MRENSAEKGFWLMVVSCELSVVVVGCGFLLRWKGFGGRRRVIL